MNLDLNKLENKIDKALSNETTESLNHWLNDKRMAQQRITPKEQAEELIESFIEFTSNEAIREDGLFYSQRMKLWNAKQCAMIAINKIIEAIDFDWMEVQNLESEHRYWDAVKREIKNYEK